MEYKFFKIMSEKKTILPFMNVDRKKAMKKTRR